MNLYGLDNGVKLAIPADEVGAVISKAKDRTAAEINHATATHDAYIISLNLAKSASAYIKGAKLCTKAARDAVEQGKPAGSAYVAARNAITDLQTQEIADAKSEGREPQIDEITGLLSGDSLDRGVSDKLRLLRDFYLKAKALYEKPTGTLDDVQQQVDDMEADFSKLAESIDAEFGSVF